MPRMHCMGTSVDIPDNGKICPRLPTNMVPSGTKCEIVCDSGSPNLEYIKCEAEGWTSTEVTCVGTPAGLIVGLLVGGIIVVCLIAYFYARMKQRKLKKTGGGQGAGATNNKNQPMSRAAKIAARNDMMVTGVVTPTAVQNGLVKPVRKPTGKLVTGAPEENQYRHHSTTTQVSNPPSYHSNDPNEERSHNSTPTKSRGRRSRNSNGEYPSTHRKNRQYYDEYAEEVDLGYHEGLPAAQPAMDGQYHNAQDNGPMYPDYYGPGTHQHGHHQHGHHQHRYGAVDHNYYRQDAGVYPDQYLEGGVDNMAYAHHHGGKPYRVPI